MYNKEEIIELLNKGMSMEEVQASINAKLESQRNEQQKILDAVQKETEEVKNKELKIAEDALVESIKDYLTIVKGKPLTDFNIDIVRNVIVPALKDTFITDFITEGSSMTDLLWSSLRI